MGPRRTTVHALGICITAMAVLVASTLGAANDGVDLLMPDFEFTSDDQ
jgi:hypothetical protein